MISNPFPSEEDISFILDLIIEYPGITYRQIREAVGMPYFKVRAALFELRRHGFIEIDKDEYWRMFYPSSITNQFLGV
jgi:DNA-binding IclR family transcriptional regulator